MLSRFLKNLSILKKFLFINFLVFLIFLIDIEICFYLIIARSCKEKLFQKLSKK